MKKAKEKERDYEWLQAVEPYGKASRLLLDENNLSNAAELQELMGFCFYRAAFQAQTSTEFRRLLKRAIQAYEMESEILEKAKEENGLAKIDHAHALVAYMRSHLETNFSKKKELANKWWLLEKQVLKTYEASGDLHSAGRICNNIIEWSIYDRFLFIDNFFERERIFKEAIRLAEKAIQVLSKIDDKYELGRAYCFASWYYGFSHEFSTNEDKIMQMGKKSQDYANKALEYSQEIEDAWLIGRSHLSAWNANYWFEWNPVLGINIAENMLKYGRIAKDNLIIGFGRILASVSISFAATQKPDPSNQRADWKKAIKLAEEAQCSFQIINHAEGSLLSYQNHSLSLNFLASIESDSKTKQELLEMSNEVIQEGIGRLRGWKRLFSLYFNLSMNLWLLSTTKTDVAERRGLLQRAQSCTQKSLTLADEMGVEQHAGHLQLSHVQNMLSSIETNVNKKIALLNKAVTSIEKYINLIEKRKKIFAQSDFGRGFNFGFGYYRFGGILQNLYTLTKKEKILCRAIEAYNKAISFYKSADLPARVAESYWNAASLQGMQGNELEASMSYESASEAFRVTAEKIPQLKDFYKDYSLYMRAWSRIEQAKHAHSIEDYDKARQNYEEAAKLHESTDSWNYLSSNYFAWANLEEAESLSRKENAQLAKEAFQKALDYFNQAEISIKLKIEESSSEEEKNLNARLLEASDLRRRFCQARIQIEEARLLDRGGKYLQSSKSYGEATRKIESILEKMDSDTERKELELLATLCQAWEKMATAEETTSAESYLEAASLFEQAKGHCYTRKASLWALGNSNFCRGLAAGVEYQTRLDLAEHAKAKEYMTSASTNYSQAGFKNASEYAKATQRLFDAYLVMNQAEREADQEKRAKQYQMAENLLQISAGSFMKAKQPEKTAQVQQLLRTVGEEKALAASLAEVLHAPTVTSSTMSFSAPSPTSETSVGLEQFQHANVQANLIAGMREVKVGESFCITVEFVNAGKEPALLTRVEDFIPQDFIVVKKPEIYRLEDSCLNMKGKQIAPLKLVEAKLVLQPSKKGLYQLKPTVHYLDEMGQSRSLQLKSVEIRVEEVIIADRVLTGTRELDSLLLGGIPEEYAVVLTGPPSDERELIVRNFLEAGTDEGQPSFYVATEAVGLENLLKKSGFYLFLCNPKPKVEVPDLSNVYRLLGKTDLTNLNIALLKAYRSVEQSSNKRVCLEIVSDVLLRYGAEATRRWISELTTDMVSKGFTILAVMNPAMHPPDQATAVVDLFDGEISLYQTEDPLECKKSIRVKKLRNQDYIKNPICLI